MECGQKGKDSAHLKSAKQPINPFLRLLTDSAFFCISTCYAQLLHSWIDIPAGTKGEGPGTAVPDADVEAYRFHNDISPMNRTFVPRTHELPFVANALPISHFPDSFGMSMHRSIPVTP